MKTTIEIPEPIYKKAKILAVENGQTLKQIVIRALKRELDDPTGDSHIQQTFSQRRRLLPSFSRHQAAGAYRPGAGHQDITELISDERDAH